MEHYYNSDEIFQRNHTSPVTEANIKAKLDAAKSFFKGALKALYQEKKPGDMNPDKYVNQIMTRKEKNKTEDGCSFLDW